MGVPAKRIVALLAFAAAMLLASLANDTGASGVTEAVIWLPSGVAVAGVYLLGVRSCWIVALNALLHRFAHGYDALITIPAVVGSTCEALFGALLLRTLAVGPDLARLRDVLSVFAAACLAPTASLLFSWIGRIIAGWRPELPFYAGWDAWWRMNALGVLTVVPVALTWCTPPRQALRLRPCCEGIGLLLGTLALLWVVMMHIPPGPTAIMALYVTLPVTLLVALRFGQRAAIAHAACYALFVYAVGIQGIGPFVAEPLSQRHVVMQIFELTLLGVPLVIGALIAERDSSDTRWLQSERLRSALLAVLPDISYRMDRHGTFLEMFTPDGMQPPVPRKELVGRTIDELAEPVLARRVHNAIAGAARGKPPEPVEYPVETTDGLRYREARYMRLPDGDFLALVRDITDRKRAERMLSWQTQMLELIASARSNVEIFAALVSGIERLMPHSTASLLMLEGSRLHTVCAPNLPQEFCAAIDGSVIGSGQGSCGTAAHENRTVVVTDIGTDPLWQGYREVALPHGLRACWSVPVRSSTGAVFGTFAIYYRQVRSPGPGEIALVERVAVLAGIAVDRERRESLLASIQHNVSDGLFRSVPGERLVYANEAFARLFGYGSPEDLLRSLGEGPAIDANHAEDLARLAALIPGSDTQELQLHRRDGSTFWGLLSRTAVLGPDGVPTACDGALADITNQKHLAEQLRQAQKMEAIGKLAGGVAHDFNNLLTAIGGYAEAVRDALPPQSELRDELGEILHATERASGLTRQLLAFGRRQVLCPQVVDLTAVVDKLASMLRRLIGEHIHFVTRGEPHGCCVRVDRGQLEQVLLNLVVNARDAMPDGGTLTITTEHRLVDTDFANRHSEVTPGSYVALAVRDTGVGMSPEVQSRAFDPFFTTKELGQGTGLGLATVYGIVKQSGGAVWIESAPGAGTTIWILLPQVHADPDQEKIVVLPRAPTHRATVLLAEDEHVVRSLVQRILSRAGYLVLAAADGPSALALAEQHQGAIDLLLTDVVMPQMTGRELATRLLALRPGTPILFMSGYASEGSSLMAAIPGPVDFVQKPFVAANLLEVIANLLAAVRKPNRNTELTRPS